MDLDLNFYYNLSVEEYKEIVSKKTNSFLEESKGLEGKISELRDSIRNYRTSGNYLKETEQYDEIYDLMRKIYFRGIELVDFLNEIEPEDEKIITTHNNLIKQLEEGNKKNFDNLYWFIEKQLEGVIPSASIVPC